MRVAGIMSGTSLDGIDVAIVDVGGRPESITVRTVATRFEPYSDDVRAALLAVSDSATETRDIARLHFLLPQLYAEAFQACCRQAKVAPSSVELIGSHGQTIFHEGTPFKLHGRKTASTLQIGDGSVLAELTGKPVVSDFRPRDVAAGGQGAPLVPCVDWLLLRSPDKGRAVLNIGGIANVTLLAPDATAEEVVAFDTGPGNLIIDQLMMHATGGKQRCDTDGAFGARGCVDPSLLAEWMADDFYSRNPPKSAGREQYGKAFIASALATGKPIEDLVATATHLTAATIADAICSADPDFELISEVVASGGGVHNPLLMKFLRAELPEEFELTTSADHGIDPDFKEAIAFAILAHQTWHRQPSNLPSATGARRAVVLGKVSF